MKLIDFGIAKLTRPELGAESVVPTGPQQQMLTPAYASPEQARGGSITTATDVYSLGVVLYELLIGHRPFERTLGGLQPDAQQWETEATRPSVALDRKDVPNEQAEKRSEKIATARNTTSSKLKRQLSGDLDTIVLTAMRIEPQRRYVSAEKMSEDIRQFLDGLAINARRAGRAEQLWRWCRRNPVPSSLAVGLLVGLSFGQWYHTQLSIELVRQAALESAAQQSEMIDHFNAVYSDVVREVERRDPEAI